MCAGNELNEAVISSLHYLQIFLHEHIVLVLEIPMNRQGNRALRVKNLGKMFDNPLLDKDLPILRIFAKSLEIVVFILRHAS